MFSTMDSEMWSPFLGEAMTHVKMDFSLPPLAKDGELDALQAPVLVHAADQDIQFPGQAAIDRATVVFPNLRAALLLKDCKHVPPFDASFTGS